MGLRAAILILSIALLMGAISGRTAEANRRFPQQIQTKMAVGPSSPVRYRINADQSKFMAHVGSGGLLWFLGHGHHIAIRDFTGEAQFTPGTMQPASLQLRINADSLEETDPIFTEQQKQIINGAMRKEVLETAEYPEIVFKSTDVSIEQAGENQYKAKVGGDLTLHGVTRHIVIPARVTLNGDRFQATGEFSVKRSDYRIKTKSVKWGMVRVRNKVTFSFDIIGNKHS